MSLLLPDGIHHLSEIPYTLHEAILTGLRILQYEEFPKEERPPRNIWLDGERLSEWWEEVDRKRAAKFKIDGSSGHPVDEDSWEENSVELITRG